MTPTVTLAVLIGAFLAAALGGALGMAGGIFLVPLLTFVTGLPFEAAVAVSLVSVVACSCASSPSLIMQRLTNIRLAVLLGVASSLGALGGLLAVGVIPERVLYGLFAAVLAVSAVQMMQGRRARVVPVPAAGRPDRAAGLGLHSSYPGPDGAEIRYRVASPGTGCAAMFGAGILSTLLGIGSGVLKIPAMDMALRLPLKVSSATANLMIGITAAGAAVAVIVAGRVYLGFAAPAVVGSVVGSLLGARVLLWANPSHLRVVFVCVLVLLTIPMALAAVEPAWPGTR